MKQSVPSTAKIAKDAKECVQECVSEFISFITSEAAEKCHMEKRKTIGGEDILYAMATLGFENYAETLKIHLAKLRQVRRWTVPLSLLALRASLRFASSCLSGDAHVRVFLYAAPSRQLIAPTHESWRRHLRT